MSRRIPVPSAGRPLTFTLRRVELEIAPEPSEAERAALEAVLARLDVVELDSPAAYRSAWREAALAAALDERAPQP